MIYDKYDPFDSGFVQDVNTGFLIHEECGGVVAQNRWINHLNWHNELDVDLDVLVNTAIDTREALQEYHNK